MARARRQSGSASARRLVACSNAARLLRAVATSGWSGPSSLVDRQGPAVERLGLGQAVGGLQQRRQVVEADGDVGVVRAVAALVDRQGPAVERLGLGQAVGVLEQLRQVVEVGGDVGVVRAKRARRWPGPGGTAARRRWNWPRSCQYSTQLIHQPGRRLGQPGRVGVTRRPPPHAPPGASRSPRCGRRPRSTGATCIHGVQGELAARRCARPRRCGRG